jgi:hypothetical protein
MFDRYKAKDIAGIAGPKAPQCLLFPAFEWRSESYLIAFERSKFDSSRNFQFQSTLDPFVLILQFSRIDDAALGSKRTKTQRLVVSQTMSIFVLKSYAKVKKC